MKTASFLSIALSALMFTACGDSKSSDSAPAPAAAEATATEHCVKADACFLELAKNGSSTFYSSESSYNALLTDQVVSQMNIQVEKMSDESYAETVKSNNAPKIVYNVNDPSNITVYQNGNFIVPLIRIVGSAGKVFKNLMAALSGLASIFDIASVIDEWSNNGNVKATVTNHFGSDVSSEEIVIKKD
jgi:hypothetical protein